MKTICFKGAGQRHREMSEEKFLRYYEPDRKYVLNTLRADGFWHYWMTKRGGKRVYVSRTYESNISDAQKTPEVATAWVAEMHYLGYSLDRCPECGGPRVTGSMGVACFKCAHINGDEIVCQ